MHKLPILLRKKKFNKEIDNAHKIMLIVLKNINSFHFKKKDEVLLKSSATSIKMRKNKISITLRFNTLISVVYFEKKNN